MLLNFKFSNIIVLHILLNIILSIYNLIYSAISRVSTRIAWMSKYEKIYNLLTTKIQ